MALIIDNHHFSASKQDRIALITFRDDIFDLISDVDKSKDLMEFVRETEHDKEINALMFMNEPLSLGNEAYDRFLRGIIKEDGIEDTDQAPNFIQKNVRFREILTINKFVRFLANYHKMYITCIDCQIATPFIGVVLVADLRLASPRALFSMVHLKYGLHPSGGIPFFLEHYVRHASAMKYQLTKEIASDEAFMLGLVDQILPSDGFVDNCLRYTKRYLSQPVSTLRYTKRLNNYNNQALDGYFDYEASLLNL